MWTNVFRIGGLQHISWFQFLPCESDPNSLPEKSLKAEQKDAATLLVLSSHLQLQNEGFLSTWTNSFVGPWDPSQGMHNPGRHSSVLETAQPAVSKLRVVGAGFWVAPGDSEEVAVALSQALRNCIERALRGLAYVRFGDVFTRCHPFAQSEKLFRRVQPTCEFIFAATEEAIFVHVIIHAKHIRTLSSDDMERVLRHRSSNNYGEKLPVIVAPHGMRGRLTGCCPSDLVKQVYFSKVNKASNGFTALGLPFHAAQSSNYQLRGQNCYVEVTIGCPGMGSSFNKNISKHHTVEPPALGKGEQLGSADNVPVLERTFIYPAETVLVPIMQVAFARSSRKRFWLQNWVGTSLFEAWPLLNIPDSSILMHCVEKIEASSWNTCQFGRSGPLIYSGFSSTGYIESLLSPWIDSNGLRPHRSYNSSSNSNSSSISSISSTSSDSDYGMPAGGRDLEADADSLTCRQSGLSMNDQFENDGQKMVSKRLCTGMTESFGQAGTVTNVTMQEAYRSEYSAIEGNNSVTAGVANDQVGSHWDWDDDDRGMGMDIQTLLSEFGDFGDFFEDDALAFGEPPGTAESQALMFPATDCGDISSSPCTTGMDVQDQMLLPALGFPSFDGFNQPPPAITEETNYKNQEFTKDGRSSGAGSIPFAPSTGEFDHLSKAEAKMTFAPEYAAVETPTSEFSTSIFRNPYLPRSRKVENSHSSSNAYVYGATPPSSPCLEASDEKPDVSTKAKAGQGKRDAGSLLQSKKYYTYVQSGQQQLDKRLVANNNSKTSSKSEALSSSVSGFNSSNAVVSLQRKKTDNILEGGHFLLSLKTVLATEVECIMFQAAMCRIRHMLLSRSNLVSIGLSRFAGYPVSDQIPSDTTTMPDKISMYDMKKRDSIPVRIAGDIDSGMLDGPVNAPVGVWRSVGVPKGTKPGSTLSVDSSSSLPHHTLNEEGMVAYGQMQPLQELLDAMAFLVQQATSFVDVSLDMDLGDGPYGWLALQEQRRRGFSCGPSMVHAGCGGLLASCHSLDIAGVELLDPLSADVHASSVISLLQSDIKVALKSAFRNLDGPLSIIDWCKGRSQSGDAGTAGDGYSTECSFSDARDPSNTVSLAVGEPISPPQSLTGVSSSLKDGARLDDSSQRRSSQEISNSESEQLSYSRLKPTLSVLPLPSILVGYQDDWLKTSSNSLQLWEKAPFEPYALPKPMTYYVVCPDINPLTSAAADFFQQLGTIYENCKLGTHSPQIIGGQMEPGSGKWSSSGFVFVECPQSMKIAGTNASIMGSVSDYLVALSKAWDVRSFLKSLSKALKTLRLGSNSMANQKEGNSGPCIVIYVVCPFPEPIAVLQTVIEASAALGSIIPSSDRERRSSLQAQVGRALSCSATGDEASTSSVLTLSGFSIPKLVLQIVSVEAIFAASRPVLNELVILKEIAFTVYSKARRISRASSSDMIQSSAISGTRQSALMHMNSPVPGLWKECVTPRIPGSSLPREGELDAGLRPGAWDNSWQTSRTVGLNCDPNRTGDFVYQEDIRYLFEPLFILAEPGSLEHGVSPAVFGNALSESSSRSGVDDSGGSYMQTSTPAGSTDASPGTMLDGSEPDSFGSSHQKTASLHCCYGWTEDWRWLVCIWTDSRGELLDSHIFPFGGISSRQDTKGLQCLFVQVLHQGCQILSCSTPDVGTTKPRDIVITRIGCFYELECQEWQKAIYSVGGNEVKKWPLQLRRSVPDGVPSSSNGTSLQQQEMSLVQERTLPSSPNPSLYSPHTKSSGFMKGVLGQANTRKQLLAGQTVVDSSRGMFQGVQSITLVGISVDHCLHLVFPAETSSPGGGTQGSGVGPSTYVEGFSPVKSLGSMPASYVLIPSPGMRYLPPTPLQLPTCLTAESPPLAHLLHSKGSAIPLSTGFVVSKAVPPVRGDSAGPKADEWPSTLSVSLIDYYGGSSSSSSSSIQEKMMRGISKQGRSLNAEVRDYDLEAHSILESVAAELHALSWMTVSPAFLERRTALPFHCDMLLRLRRLLHYADKELSQQQPEKAQQA
ncbi:mediator of RNA polymerase II transcription subunit 13 isoform X2 [Magnolia sinica]|uniref:mediator of RNA polymerase II transcription subunit 13 isoform X2 n=1 Tax=Magnolia sinica TaxID=86752 RepID=UPI00265A92D8|nr:mediator of RNA polymerase II transcription subunit 13 isoform X2 [Magnolia sinica]